MKKGTNGLCKFVVAPLGDVVGGVERCVARHPLQLVLIVVGVAVAWWLYVPCHELLHAFACLATGGEVTRLEIAPIYGAGVLSRVFPFVFPGSEYAGRLSGFDTHGSDLIYLATDLGPFILTVFPGVWLLRLAGRSGRGVLFGAAMPMAMAPFLSLTGDAYEIGSILATRMSPWLSPDLVGLVRSDDLIRTAGALLSQRQGLEAWAATIAATCFGLGWAWATYWLGGRVAQRMGQGRTPSSLSRSFIPSCDATKPNRS